MHTSDITIIYFDLDCYSTFPVSLSVTRLLYRIWIDCLPDYSTSVMASFANEEYADILFFHGYPDDDNTSKISGSVP